MTCGLAIDGGTIESENKTGAFAGGEAGSADTGFVGDGLASNFGLNRIFGTGDKSGVDGSAGVSANNGGGGVAAVNDGSCSIDGRPAGGCPSAGRSRGFSRRVAGGCACSSLMQGEEPNNRAPAKGKKFPSRSCGSAVTFKLVFNMIKAFSFVLCIGALGFSTGCLFSKKSTRPKESSTIAADVEESFRIRWVGKRASELAAQGTAPDTARSQAEGEFRERFGFAQGAKK